MSGPATFANLTNRLLVDPVIRENYQFWFFGYPSGLAFPEVAGTITNVPNRWRYPNTEVNYNPYYKEVSAEDTYYHKLFWAK